MIKDSTLCTPHIYYGETIQQYIQSNRERQEQQWVYKLIREGLANQDEQVFLDNDDFVLCTNVHHGLDDRYLVVFKDENLKTIRDLDQTHVPMLLQMKEIVKDFLKQKHPVIFDRYRFFFHYMPSVFQLHAHVSTKSMSFNINRRQPLDTVVRNLLKDAEYYQKAIILTSVTKNMRSLNVYKILSIF